MNSFNGDFVAIDFETTGLNSSSDNIIQVAAVSYVNWIAISEYSTYVKTNLKLSKKITGITGITSNDLELYGIPQKQMLLDLVDFIGDSIIVSHNITFDLSFYLSSLRRYTNISEISNSVIDTLTIARFIFYYPHKLSNLCECNGIKLENAHNAVDDVKASAELLKFCSNNVSIDDYINVVGYLNKYGNKYTFPDYIKCVGIDNVYSGSDKSCRSTLIK